MYTTSKSWLALIFCLTEKHTNAIKRCEESCDWLHHLVCGWLWMLQPVTMHSTAQKLTWLLIVVEIYRNYCLNIECPIISEVYQSPESIWSIEICKLIHRSWQNSGTWLYSTFFQTSFPNLIKLKLWPHNKMPHPNSLYRKIIMWPTSNLHTFTTTNTWLLFY